MAMDNSDGSIILSTKVDESGLKAWFSGVNTQSKNVQNNVKGIGASAKTASTQVKTALTGIGVSLKKLMTYFFGIQTIMAAIRFSGESAEFATQTEASVQRLADIYGEASDSVGNFIDANARALGMSKAAAASFSSVYGNLFSAFADQETNATLTNEYLQMTAVVASKTGRTVEDVQERVRSGLLGNTEAIEDLGIFVNVKTIEMTDAFQRMAGDKSWEQLDTYTQQQIRSMAILEQATAKYGNEVADTSATIRNQYKASYEDFQNSWGNIVNTVLLPVLQVMTQIFDIVTRGLNALSGRSGQILENAQIQEKSTNNTAENLEEQTENQKELNKETEKTTASFDDLNILSSNKPEAETETTSDSLGVPKGDSGQIDGSSVVNKTSKMLESIMRMVGVALIAIGVLLIMSPSPHTTAWGVGFIIAGAAIFGVSAAAAIGEARDLGVGAVLETIMGILAEALAAVGIVLLLKGNFPWGMGFIIAGAAVWAISEIWGEDFDPNSVSDVLSKIMETIGVSLAAVGLMLMLKGNFPWGIAFIIAGAAIWTITEFATGEFSTDPIVNTLVKIMGIAGTALLAIGIILCVFGVINPISIGLIVAGAALLVGALALSNEAVVEAIRGPLGVILAIVSGALLVLGIILVCTGVGIPIGIALILAGVAGLVTVVAVNWNAIVDWVKKAWEAVKKFWNKYIAPIFTGKFWLDLAKKCGNGLIGGFEGAINGIISLFETMINWIVKQLNKISFDVPDWVPLIGGKTFGFNIPKVKFGRVSIPRLAQGAVIPANREFLAVLGDQKHGRNLEAPEDLIRQIVREETQRPTNFTVKATGSMAQLIRLLSLEITEEQNRVSVF